MNTVIENFAAKKKMWDLTIRIKRNDELGGKRLQRLLLEMLVKAGIAGATLWTGVDGFGKRGKSTLKLEGVTVNMPLIIEVVDVQSKLEPLLPELKRIIGDNGLVSIHDIYIIQKQTSSYSVLNRASIIILDTGFAEVCGEIPSLP